MLTDKRETDNILYVIYGIMFFKLGYYIHEYFLEDAKWAKGISLLALTVIFYGLAKSKKNLYGIDLYYRNLIVFFIIWSGFLLLIGITTNLFEDNFLSLLFNSIYFWHCAMCFVLLLPIEIYHIPLLYKNAILYAFFALFMCIYFFDDFYLNVASLFVFEGFDGRIVNKPSTPISLLIPIIPFLVYFKDLPTKVRVIFISASIMGLVSALMGGRRSGATVYVVYLLCLIYINCIQNNKLKRKVVFIITSIIILFLFYVPKEGLIDIYETHFSVLANKIDSDTRSGTENDFFRDMENNPVDWIVGRGINGTYKSPEVADIDKLNRNVIETGYLNLILHGGILLLLPYAILLCGATYRGFFKSNSFFLKSCALYLFVHILALYPGGTPSMSYEYFIVFILIRICLSEYWRNLDDTEIKTVLLKKQEDE